MTSPPRGTPSLPWARNAAIVVAAGWVLLLLWWFARRLWFPLELEWMEGGILHQARRLHLGAAAYPPPSDAFVPFLYTPLYAWVLALLGTLFPIDFVLGRVVSIVSTLAIGAAIWWGVGREEKPLSHRAIAVGLFASSYVFTFRWLDLARPDAMATALALWGLVLLRDAWGNHPKAIAAAVLFALSFWTKQTGAVFALAGVLGASWIAPRQLWSYTATLLILGPGLVAWGDHATDGWLWRYIYELHQSHAFNTERFTSKTWGMFLHAAPGCVAIAVLGVWNVVAPRLLRRRRMGPGAHAHGWQWLRAYRGEVYWSFMTTVGLLVAALGYSTQWAEPNAFIPAAAVGALALGVLLPTGGSMELVCLVLAIGQMAFSWGLEPTYAPIQARGWSALAQSYARIDPTRTIPGPDVVERATLLRGRLAEVEGPVLAFHRPWWSVIAGGSGHAGSMGLHDVSPRDRQQIQSVFAQRLRQGSYSQVWLEGEPPPWMLPHLTGYQVAERHVGSQRVLPMSGYMSRAGMTTPYTRDQLLLVPVRPRQPAAGRVVADFEDGTLQGFVVHGSAFGSRAVPGITTRHPPVGPFGGEYLLSSASALGLRGTGSAISPPIGMPRGSALELLVGASEHRDDLRVTIVSVDGRHQASIPVPRARWTLAPVVWALPDTWLGVDAVQIRLDDGSANGALFLDDLWVVGEPVAPGVDGA